MDGWMDGWESRVKDCLQQSKIKIQGRDKTGGQHRPGGPRQLTDFPYSKKLKALYRL